MLVGCQQFFWCLLMGGYPVYPIPSRRQAGGPKRQKPRHTNVSSPGECISVCYVITLGSRFFGATEVGWVQFKVSHFHDDFHVALSTYFDTTTNFRSFLSQSNPNFPRPLPSFLCPITYRKSGCKILVAAPLGACKNERMPPPAAAAGQRA